MFGGSFKNRDSFDPDAQFYINAVESADGQPLEAEVRRAITRFVKGCKSDGIWGAINASCIMAGARTLSGALVPLKGDAPTNFNFVSADYDRITGLKGDGDTKHLDSNRNLLDDPLNSHHQAVFVTSHPTSGFRAYLGAGAGQPGTSQINTDHPSNNIDFRMRHNLAFSSLSFTSEGFIGMSRSSSDNYTRRVNSSTSLASQESQSAESVNIQVFARARYNQEVGLHSDARMSFYSIGEAIDLELLDNRVATLMNTLNRILP